MALYSKIYRKIWLDAKFRALSDDGKMLFLYLLTCPDSGTIPGLLRMGKAGLAESLEWEPGRLAKALPEVFAKALPKAFGKAFPEGFREAYPKALAVADWDARLIYLPNALKYNLPQSPNVVLSWGDQWDALPECDLKNDAYVAYFEALKALGEAFAKAFQKALPKPSWKPSPKPLANQDQDQDQDQEQDSSPRSVEHGGEGPDDKDDAPKSKRKIKPFEEMCPRAQVIETYCLEYERVRGVRPPFGSREGKSTDKLIETLKGDHARAMTTIRNAFADPFWREKVTINTIATEPAKFDGARQAKLALVQDDDQWAPPAALTLDELDRRIGDHDGF